MNSTYAQKSSTVQKAADTKAASVLDSSAQSESLQRKADMANNATQRAEAPRPNNTGMPDNLKAGIESLSGFSMDDVRVHYNSSKPATVQALAYTQGTDIHVAPGQEKHLPHEAWHVAQQMAGRVSPTTNINGMPVNDNAALEHEADVMGERAVQCKKIERSLKKDDNVFCAVQCKSRNRSVKWRIRANKNSRKARREPIREKEREERAKIREEERKERERLEKERIKLEKERIKLEKERIKLERKRVKQEKQRKENVFKVKYDECVKFNSSIADIRKKDFYKMFSHVYIEKILTSDDEYIESLAIRASEMLKNTFMTERKGYEPDGKGNAYKAYYTLKETLKNGTEYKTNFTMQRDHIIPYSLIMKFLDKVFIMRENQEQTESQIGEKWLNGAVGCLWSDECRDDALATDCLEKDVFENLFEKKESDKSDETSNSDSNLQAIEKYMKNQKIQKDKINLRKATDALVKYNIKGKPPSDEMINDMLKKYISSSKSESLEHRSFYTALKNAIGWMPGNIFLAPHPKLDDDGDGFDRTFATLHERSNCDVESYRNTYINMKKFIAGSEATFDFTNLNNIVETKTAFWEFNPKEWRYVNGKAVARYIFKDENSPEIIQNPNSIPKPNDEQKIFKFEDVLKTNQKITDWTGSEAPKNLILPLDSVQVPTENDTKDETKDQAEATSMTETPPKQIPEEKA